MKAPNEKFARTKCQTVSSVYNSAMIIALENMIDECRKIKVNRRLDTTARKSCEKLIKKEKLMARFYTRCETACAYIRDDL